MSWPNMAHQAQTYSCFVPVDFPGTIHEFFSNCTAFPMCVSFLALSLLVNSVKSERCDAHSALQLNNRSARSLPLTEWLPEQRPSESSAFFANSETGLAISEKHETLQRLSTFSSKSVECRLNNVRHFCAPTLVYLYLGTIAIYQPCSTNEFNHRWLVNQSPFVGNIKKLSRNCFLEPLALWSTSVTMITYGLAIAKNSVAEFKLYFFFIFCSTPVNIQ